MPSQQEIDGDEETQAINQLPVPTTDTAAETDIIIPSTLDAPRDTNGRLSRRPQTAAAGKSRGGSLESMSSADGSQQRRVKFKTILASTKELNQFYRSQLHKQKKTDTFLTPK